MWRPAECDALNVPTTLIWQPVDCAALRDLLKPAASSEVEAHIDHLRRAERIALTEHHRSTKVSGEVT